MSKRHVFLFCIIKYCTICEKCSFLSSLVCTMKALHVCFFGSLFWGASSDVSCYLYIQLRSLLYTLYFLLRLQVCQNATVHDQRHQRLSQMSSLISVEKSSPMEHFLRYSKIPHKDMILNLCIIILGAGTKFLITITINATVM